jgi:hypothetical protein
MVGVAHIWFGSLLKMKRLGVYVFVLAVNLNKWSDYDLLVINMGLEFRVTPG